MAASKRLAAHRAAALSADAQEPTQLPEPAIEPGEDETEDQSNPEKSTMTQEEIDKAIAEASAKATATANQRYSAVLASEHYTGREQLAQTLLGNDKMSAEDIIGALKAAPAPAAAAQAGAGALTEDQQREAAEAAGRATMTAAIAETSNSGIQPGDAAKPDAAAQHGDMWATAYGAPKEGAK